VVRVPRNVLLVLVLVVMVALIVGVDLLFLRDSTWARLAVNVAIVAVFLTIALLIRRRG
jgi:hypothetical protein